MCWLVSVRGPPQKRKRRDIVSAALESPAPRPPPGPREKCNFSTKNFPRRQRKLDEQPGHLPPTGLPPKKKGGEGQLDVASPWQLADRPSIQNNHKPRLHIIYECGFCCAASEWVVFGGWWAVVHSTHHLPPTSACHFSLSYYFCGFFFPCSWQAKIAKGAKPKRKLLNRT